MNCIFQNNSKVRPYPYRDFHCLVAETLNHQYIGFISFQRKIAIIAGHRTCTAILEHHRRSYDGVAG